APAVGTAGARRAALRRRAGAGRGSSLRALWLVLGAIAVAVGIALVSGSGDTLPSRWGELVALRRSGDVDAGRALLAELREGWAGEDTARNARLDALARDLEAIAEGLELGRERIRSEAAQKT